MTGTNSPLRIWGLSLLVLGLVLLISGVELALHEAAERDCSDGTQSVCLQCLALSTAPASLDETTRLPAPAPARRLCPPGRPECEPQHGAEAVPGRSPPSVLPA